MGRPWYSQAGKRIWPFSVRLFPRDSFALSIPADADVVGGWGQSAIQEVKQVSHFELGRPNDLFIAGRKVAVSYWRQVEMDHLRYAATDGINAPYSKGDSRRQ